MIAIVVPAGGLLLFAAGVLVALLACLHMLLMGSALVRHLLLLGLDRRNGLIALAHPPTAGGRSPFPHVIFRDFDVSAQNTASHVSAFIIQEAFR
jgi:hypothetical protein